MYRNSPDNVRRVYSTCWRPQWILRQVSHRKITLVYLRPASATHHCCSGQFCLPTPEQPMQNSAGLLWEEIMHIAPRCRT